jgi:hypothetical protein
VILKLDRCCSAPDRFLIFVALIWLETLCGLSLGLMISSFAKSVEVAQVSRGAS